MVSKPAKWLPALLGAGIAVFTLLVFLPVKENGFINLDDQLYLTENEVIKKGFSKAGFHYAFTNVAATGNWHPITWLSLMLDVELFGMDAGAHHMVSVVIHALNGLLLFLLLNRFTGSLWTSAFVAAVFAFHPLRVESVVWASERKDLLCALFGFLAILAYWKFTQAKLLRQRPGLWLGLALAAHALSLMSKPMLVTLPFLLLLLDFWPLQRIRAFRTDGRGESWLTLIWEKSPFFVLTVCSCLIAVFAQAKAGAVVPMQVFSMETRVANAAVSALAYLENLFWPSGLCPFYPYRTHISDGTFWLAVVALIGVSALCWTGWKSRPYLAVGWFWYLGLLVPVIGLVQVGSQSMADRYTYLPTIGVVIAVAWTIRSVSVSRRFAPVLAIPAAILLGLLARNTFNQTLLWRNSETIFNHTLAVTRENAIAHESLGLVLADRGAVRQAAWHFAQAVRIWPRYADALSDLGLALSLQGQHQEALPYAQKAVEVSPEAERMRYNLAKLYMRMGSNELARIEFERFLTDFPHSDQGTISLAELYLEAGNTEQAIGVLAEHAQNQPASVSIQTALAQALQMGGDSDKALAALDKAISIAPTNANVHFQRGTLLLRMRQPDQAVAALQNAVRIAPVAEYYLALAEAYSELRQDAEAIRHYEQSLELKPDVPASLNNLAWLLATTPSRAMRDGAKAVSLAERANELTGNRQPFLLGTLAAAYAEAGRFPDAITTAERAIELATAAGQPEVAARNRELLALYRTGRPYHEPAPML